MQNEPHPQSSYLPDSGEHSCLLKDPLSTKMDRGNTLNSCSMCLRLKRLSTVRCREQTSEQITNSWALSRHIAGTPASLGIHRGKSQSKVTIQSMQSSTVEFSVCNVLLGALLLTLSGLTGTVCRIITPSSSRSYVPEFSEPSSSHMFYMF